MIEILFTERSVVLAIQPSLSASADWSADDPRRTSSVHLTFTCETE
jgi:hypothetical protein